MGTRTIVEIPEGFVPVNTSWGGADKPPEYTMEELARDIQLVKQAGGVSSAAGQRLIARLRPKYQRWFVGLRPSVRNRKVRGNLFRLYGGSQPAASN